MKNRLLMIAASLAVAVASGVASPGAQAATAPPADLISPTPLADPFLKAPANLATYAPGAIIRKRAVTTYVNGLGLGIQLGATNALGEALAPVAVPMPAKATELLIRSTDAHARPAAVVTTVLVPTQGANHHLLSWQVPIDSLGSRCNPSYESQKGAAQDGVFIAQALLKGYTVVVPDHEGPRNAFAAGPMAGHAVLDSIRATLTLPGTQLAGAATKVAMMGYSGGAIATGWATQLLPTYAPRLNVIGVASGGTPGNLYRAYQQMDGSASGGLFVGAALGMAREYPELYTLLNPAGMAFARSIKDDCLVDLTSHIGASVKQYTYSSDPMNTAIAQNVLNTNKMGGTAPRMPYLLWQARNDELIPYDIAVTLQKQWCARGGKVQLITNEYTEHLSGTGAMAEDSFTWLDDRFAGKPFTGYCQG